MIDRIDNASTESPIELMARNAMASDVLPEEVVAFACHKCCEVRRRPGSTETREIDIYPMMSVFFLVVSRRAISH